MFDEMHCCVVNVLRQPGNKISYLHVGVEMAAKAT